MMPILNTPVAQEALPFRLDMASRIVCFGSCFADEVGERMLEGGLQVELNPFGTLYNPASIASALTRMVQDEAIGMGDLVQHDGLWHSWHHHGSFSAHQPEVVLSQCNDRMRQARKVLAEAQLLVVTWGTSYVFEHQGRVVANCHKVPAIQFKRRRMEVDEIVSLWHPLLECLASFNPQLTVLFTVSPIRHLADGAHGNQLSKATLLLAADSLVSTHDRTAYFPAYEIVLDELRDYRFYGPDMTHPTSLTVDIVWHRFQEATMSPAVQQQVHNNSKQAKRNKHISIHL